MSDLRFKDQIRCFIEHFGITPSELARRTSVPKTTLADYMRGVEPKKMIHVKAIAKEFKTSIDHMLFGNGILDDFIKEALIDQFVSDRWLSGLFEIKIRRVNKDGQDERAPQRL